MRRITSTGCLLIMLLVCSSTAIADKKIRSLCNISYPSDSRVQWQCLKLKWTDTPSGLFGERW